MKRNSERDSQIIKFINNMGVASFSTLYELFFKELSEKAAYKVIKRICDYGELECERHFFVNERIFWIPKSKPKQLKHELIRSEFYKHVSKSFKIIKFQNEFTFFEGFRPDAFIAFETPLGNNHYGFLEVEISNNKTNFIDKYVEFYKSGKWSESKMEEFPIIFIVTDKEKLKLDPNITFIVTDEYFKNFSEVIKKIE